MGQNQSLEIDVPANRKVNEAGAYFVRTLARALGFILCCWGLAALITAIAHLLQVLA